MNFTMEQIHEKIYSLDDVIAIIDKQMRDVSARKDRYIEMNGKDAYKHTDVMHAFSGETSALHALWSAFEHDAERKVK